jgi:hypothetical protein
MINTISALIKNPDPALILSASGRIIIDLRAYVLAIVIPYTSTLAY